MIKEHEVVVLRTDLPEYGLKQGDVGTVVLAHAGGKGYEVEFATLNGDTLAVVTVMASQVRPAKRREVAQARMLAHS